jgi:hypothetical protein
MRLGPSMHRCRACMHVFTSGELEWAAMPIGARAGYFGQNALKLFPLALVFCGSVAVSMFMNMVPDEDLAEYTKQVALGLTAGFAVLSAWSVLLVLFSLRRSSRMRRSRNWNSYQQTMLANQKFISDATWERARSTRYARLDLLQEAQPPAAAEPAAKLQPASVRLTMRPMEPTGEIVEAMA